MTIVAAMTKIHRRIAIGIFAVLIAALASPHRIQAGAPLSITEADDGETLELMKDDSLVITLEANSSTDYRWQILKNNDAILKPAGPPNCQGGKPGEKPQMIGAPGHTVFSFSAIAAGKETMELGYARPTDHDPAKTFTVTITVGE
jgi:predicted secreted protein